MIGAEFWESRKVLVTGHTGFKGGWLSHWLKQLGATVYGVSSDVLAYPNLYAISEVGKSMDVDQRIDIRDLDKLKAFVQSYQPNVVFHLAAQPLVRFSYLDPVYTYTTNVIGTLNVLESVRSVNSVESLLIVTSDKCYENTGPAKSFSEDDKMGGYDPYSSSKGCVEIMCSAYWRSYLSEVGIGLATLRAGNVIGGGDWADDRIIPDAIRAFSADVPLVLRNPDAIRPWQHVLEPLFGYIVLAEKITSDPEAFSGAWNFGPEDADSKSVGEVATILVNEWGTGASWNKQVNKDYYEARHLELDCSKTKKRLGVYPVWNIEKSIRTTVRWYKAWRAGLDMHLYTKEEIGIYSSDRAVK